MTAFDRTFSFHAAVICLAGFWSPEMPAAVQTLLPAEANLVVLFLCYFIVGFLAAFWPPWIKLLRWEPPQGKRNIIPWIGFGLLEGTVLGYLKLTQPDYVTYLIPSTLLISWMLSAALLKKERAVWIKICDQKGTRRPWEHWTWGWSLRRSQLLVAAIAAFPDSVGDREDAIRAEIRRLVGFDRIENGTVHWKDGEEWRGIVEWGRYEGFEMNVAGHNQNDATYQYFEDSLAGKYCKDPTAKFWGR